MGEKTAHKQIVGLCVSTNQTIKFTLFAVAIIEFTSAAITLRHKRETKENE